MKKIYSSISFALSLILVLFFLQIVSFNSSYGQTRKGLFKTKREHSVSITEKSKDDYAMFSLGTLFGLSVNFAKSITYKVQNGIVVTDRIGEIPDQLVPGVYAFPSINLVGTPGNSLSFITPVNINPSSDIAYGLGFSYGFNVRSTVELGLSLVMIWSDIPSLSEAQKISLNSGEPLPANESYEIGKKKHISFGIGIYISPLIK